MVTQVRGRSSGVVATLIAVLLASGLIFVATKGIIYAAVAVVLAAYLAFVVTFGSRVTGIACMMAAFATAPSYRGLEQMIGGIPPCDAFVIIAVIHLLPTFAGNKLKLPTVYLSGLLIMSVMSLVSVIVTGDLLINAFYAVQWLFFIGVLPILVAWWRPELRAINLMLWSYLGGHLIASSGTGSGSRVSSASAAGAPDFQIRSGSSFTSSLVRPVSTERGWSSGSHPSTACSSFLCRSSHCSLSPSLSELPRRTSTSRPRSFSPCISACSSPSASCAAGSPVFAGSQVPVSHTMTSPPPYSPLGMTPSKCRYSIGWSSTCTAIRLVPGSSVGPFGTAQLTSTPSISNRRS